MLCSKLHCQKVLIEQPFHSCEIVAPGEADHETRGVRFGDHHHPSLRSTPLPCSRLLQTASRLLLEAVANICYSSYYSRLLLEASYDVRLSLEASYYSRLIQIALIPVPRGWRVPRRRPSPCITSTCASPPLEAITNSLEAIT